METRTRASKSSVIFPLKANREKLGHACEETHPDPVQKDWQFRRSHFFGMKFALDTRTQARRSVRLVVSWRLGR